MVVTLANASFGSTAADTTKTTVLKNINLRLERGGLHIVTGSAASGKSTLKGLLGEASQLAGVAHVNETEVAFCDQTVWLQNGTVRQNIVAFEEYDEVFYKRVIKAVSLGHDLETSPKGDQTIVGSNGLALSGGQKRRIVRRIPVPLKISILTCAGHGSFSIRQTEAVYSRQGFWLIY